MLEAVDWLLIFRFLSFYWYITHMKFIKGKYSLATIIIHFMTITGNTSNFVVEKRGHISNGSPQCYMH